MDEPCGQCERYAQKLDGLEELIQDLKEQVRELEADRDDQLSRRLDLKERFEELQDDLDAVVAEKDELSGQVMVLEDENKFLRKDIAKWEGSGRWLSVKR